MGQRARFGSAAAACLLVGFFLGWLGHERNPASAGGGAAYPVIVGGANVSRPIDAPTIQEAAPGPLGVRIHEIPYHDAPLLVVRRVDARSPLAQAGLRDGDQIVSLDGERVRDVRELSAAINRGGGPRILRVLRDGQLLELGVRFQVR